jgi:hypothetical protein
VCSGNLAPQHTILTATNAPLRSRGAARHAARSEVTTLNSRVAQLCANVTTTSAALGACQSGTSALNARVAQLDAGLAQQTAIAQTATAGWAATNSSLHAALLGASASSAALAACTASAPTAVAALANCTHDLAVCSGNLAQELTSLNVTQGSLLSTAAARDAARSEVTTLNARVAQLGANVTATAATLAACQSGAAAVAAARDVAVHNAAAASAAALAANATAASCNSALGGARSSAASCAAALASARAAASAPCNVTAPPCPSCGGALPQVAFVSTSIGTTESAGIVAIALSRSGDLTSASAVKVVVVSGGTATAGLDFTLLVSWVVFDAGAASAAAEVAITLDALTEGTETASFALARPLACSVGTPSALLMQIADTSTGTLFARRRARGFVFHAVCIGARTRRRSGCPGRNARSLVGLLAISLGRF